MDEFCTRLAEALDVDELKPTDVLKSFEAWDSMGVLSALAMIDSNYGKQLSSADLRGVNTVADLFAMLGRP